MDFDGTISTEVALFRKKEEYKDSVTRRLPVGNDATELTVQVATFGPMIPNGLTTLSSHTSAVNLVI